MTSQTDWGASGADDDRRITTEYTRTGLEKVRVVRRSNASGDAWPKKQETRWSYLENGLVKTLVAKNGSGAVVESHTLGYVRGGVYGNGQRLQERFVLKGPAATACQWESSPCTARYDYDGRDRLVRYEDGRGKTTSFTLDVAGNVTRKKVGSADPIEYEYVGERLVRETEGSQTLHYFYNADGHVRCVTKTANARDCKASKGGSASGTLAWLYAYDPRGRMLGSRSFGGGVELGRTTFAYDGLDRVVRKRERRGGVSGSWAETAFGFVGLSDLVVEEETAGGAKPGVKRYGFDAAGRRLWLVDEPASASAGTYSYGYDVHGSVSLLLADSGSVKASYGYEPYGQIDTGLTRGDVNTADTKKPPENPLNPYRYMGKRVDPASGSYDMGARRYAESAGRFLQRDLYLGALANLTLGSDLLTGNRYAMAGGNPVGYIERDGHRPDDIAGGGGVFTPEKNPSTGKRHGTGWRRHTVSQSGQNPQLEGSSGRVPTPVDSALIAPFVYGTPEYYARFNAPLEEDDSLEWLIGPTGVVKKGVPTAGKKVWKKLFGKADEGVRYGPLNRGPLPNAVASTFRGGSYTGRRVSEATTLYRVHGGKADEIGLFWTRTPPAGSIQARIDLALDPAWGNTASRVTTIRVPGGTTIYEGFAAGRRGLVGGGSQVVIPNVNTSWVVP